MQLNNEVQRCKECACWPTTNNKLGSHESDDIILVEGNSYFPLEAVNKEFLKESDTETVCHWKGMASYYDLQIEGATNRDAAWYYSEPRPLADGIKGRVAFWKGVQVVRD